MNKLSSSALTFSPLHLAFDEHDQEAAFITEHNRQSIPLLRLTILLFLLGIAIPMLVELAGFYQEGWDGYDYWLGMLPYRIGSMALLAVGLALTFNRWCIAQGQWVVSAFVLGLIALVFASSQWYGPWIQQASTMFNFGMTLALVASGLLIRWSAPLIVIAVTGWLLILMQWQDNAFAFGFISLATAVTMIWIMHRKEHAEREAWAKHQQLNEEKNISEQLLLNVLPQSIAARMRNGETLIADKHEHVAVVFADIVNFTPLSASITPEQLVEILDDVFSRFDAIADELNLEKIKTIGDAYLLAAGLPSERPPSAANALNAALRMKQAIMDINTERNTDLDIRAGAHIGEVVAGVIGKSKFVYDIWGDTVNVASRMESTAPRGAIQVSNECYEELKQQFDFTDRGDIDIKGKGLMRTWLLN